MDFPALPQTFWAFMGLVVVGVFWVVVRPLLGRFFALLDRLMDHQAVLARTLENHFVEDRERQAELLAALAAIADRLDRMN